MPGDSWAVVIPSVGGEFHRINSLEMLYNQDTIIGYGLDRDKSWILYILLTELGMESVINMALTDVMELVNEVKKLSWIEAVKMVDQLKVEGYS